ncbi:hypothetical protein Tco_1253851 [Tanacetum coccineum]
MVSDRRGTALFPTGKLNGIPVALVARFVVISKSTDRILPLVDEDGEEDGDLSLEAMEDEEVALVDGVFEGAFGALGYEWWCVVEALVGVMEVIEFTAKAEEDPSYVLTSPEVD